MAGRLKAICGRFRSFLGAVELGLKDSFKMCGRELDSVPSLCEFCEDPPNKASFLVKGVNKSRRLVRVRCCLVHRQAIESSTGWIVHNLRMVYGLEQWCIQALD